MDKFLQCQHPRCLFFFFGTSPCRRRLWRCWEYIDLLVSLISLLFFFTPTSRGSAFTPDLRHYSAYFASTFSTSYLFPILVISFFSDFPHESTADFPHYHLPVNMQTRIMFNIIFMSGCTFYCVLSFCFISRPW